MMTSSLAGTSTSLNGEVMVCFCTMFSGRHRALGSSLLSVSLRRLYSAAAQAWKGTSSGFRSAGDVDHVLGNAHPNACQVGLAVGPSRSGRSQDGLTIGGARSALGRIVEPLRRGRRRHHSRQNQTVQRILELHYRPPESLRELYRRGVESVFRSASTV